MEVSGNPKSMKGNEDCGEGEDSEPDSYSKFQANEQRKGRFIIEEIEEKMNGEYNYDYYIDEVTPKRQLFSSFREKKFLLNHTIIDDTNSNYNIKNNQILLKRNSKLIDNITALVYNFKTENFIECSNVFQDKICSFDILFKFTDLFNSNTQNIKNEVNYYNDITDKDNAMITEEDFIENEKENEIKELRDEKSVQDINYLKEEKNETFNPISTILLLNDFNLITKNLNLNPPRFKSFDINFTCFQNNQFASPSCSPIHSPGQSKKNLTLKNISNKKNRTKISMIKNYIQTIEDSFNLDIKKERSTTYKTCSIPRLFANREKRLYSEEKQFHKGSTANKEPNNDIKKLNSVLPTETKEKSLLPFDLIDKFEIINSEKRVKVYENLSIDHEITFCSLGNCSSIHFSELNSTNLCENCHLMYRYYKINK